MMIKVGGQIAFKFNREKNTRIFVVFPCKHIKITAFETTDKYKFIWFLNETIQETAIKLKKKQHMPNN